MRGGLRLRLAFQAGEMLHVDLQWVAVGAVLVNQLARQFHFFGWNLVEGIDLGVIDYGYVEAVFYRFVQKDRVQDAAGIGI